MHSLVFSRSFFLVFSLCRCDNIYVRKNICHSYLLVAECLREKFLSDFRGAVLASLFSFQNSRSISETTVLMVSKFLTYSLWNKFFWIRKYYPRKKRTATLWRNAGKWGERKRSLVCSLQLPCRKSGMVGKKVFRGLNFFIFLKEAGFPAFFFCKKVFYYLRK